MIASKQVGALTFQWRRVRLENDVLLRRPKPLAALSIEFVAKPEKVHCLRDTVPATVRDGLEQAPGFAGCLVMISDREARLVSVVTFWTGEGQKTYGSKRARWLRRLLTPYVDHCLRIGTLDAYLTPPDFARGDVAERKSPAQCETCTVEKPSVCVV
jgi:hypothetical protein